MRLEIQWPGEAKWDSALSDEYGQLPLSPPPDFKRIPRGPETPANGAHHRHRRLLRARRQRPRRRAAEQRDKLTASIKKTRSHGTIAIWPKGRDRPREAINGRYAPAPRTTRLRVGARVEFRQLPLHRSR